MPKLYWVPYFSPYIVGIITYIVLKILQRMDGLKSLDKYLWSPFAVAFGFVFLLIHTSLSYYDNGALWLIKSVSSEKFESIHDFLMMLIMILYFGIMMFQFLWLSIFFQILAIKKGKKIYLNFAIIFTSISILLPICAEIFVGKIS